MQLTITGHHLEITIPLKEYVENKLERLQRHFDQITTIHVILTVEKVVQRAEATIHISGGTYLRMQNQKTCTPPSTLSPINWTAS